MEPDLDKVHHESDSRRPPLCPASTPQFPSSYLDFRPKCVGVPLQDGFHCALPRALILPVVEAVDAITGLAVPPRGKALAIPAG